MNGEGKYYAAAWAPQPAPGKAARREHALLVDAEEH